MYQPRSIQSSMGLRDRILSIDYILVVSILVLGVISMFAMYSTDGGEFKYHTNSHILRFCVFFALFFLVSLIQIRFWHDQRYLIYISFFILLCLLIYLLINLFTEILIVLSIFLVVIPLKCFLFLLHIILKIFENP